MKRPVAAVGAHLEILGFRGRLEVPAGNLSRNARHVVLLCERHDAYGYRRKGVK